MYLNLNVCVLQFPSSITKVHLPYFQLVCRQRSMEEESKIHQVFSLNLEDFCLSLIDWIMIKNKVKMHPFREYDKNL